MKRKIISITIDYETLNQIDKLVVRPCSRSDIINCVLEYILNSPGIIEHFVHEKNVEFERCANNTQEN